MVWNSRETMVDFVVCRAGSFGGDAVVNVVNERVHDVHVFAGDTSVRVNLVSGHLALWSFRPQSLRSNQKKSKGYQLQEPLIPRRASVPSSHQLSSSQRQLCCWRRYSSVLGCSSRVFERLDPQVCRVGGQRC